MVSSHASKGDTTAIIELFKREVSGNSQSTSLQNIDLKMLVERFWQTPESPKEALKVKRKLGKILS